MNKPSDYVWIEKWGQMMGSYRYYIEQQQQEAASDNAPLNAIYRDQKDGKWKWETTDDIVNEDTKRMLGL